MPIKSLVNQTQSGEMETARVILLSELIAELVEREAINDDGELSSEHDMIVIGLPDTGKAAFNGSHEIKSGKSAGKMSKATFVVAELGSSFAGQPIDYKQTKGDVALLPLSVKLSITATPPNREGADVDSALNRIVDVPVSGETLETAATAN